MPQYKVAGVLGTREYDTKFGRMVGYKLKLEGVGDPVQLSKKSESRPPQQGDVLTGTIEHGEYGDKFKVEYNQGGQSYGRPSQSSAPSTSAAAPTSDENKAMWAIGKAVDAVGIGAEDSIPKVLETARKLYDAVDTLDTTNPYKNESGIDADRGTHHDAQPDDL